MVGIQILPVPDIEILKRLNVTILVFKFPVFKTDYAGLTFLYWDLLPTDDNCKCLKLLCT